ncbi:hypothetical protein NDU88_001741 [Pleurodeles waltl]|uniref:Uncharacterized protein n=1 Tax=Pleurodeles waltl TaxID=8319 RepID=A0AAV7VCN0_PLEWA|nr:hypothetical protein NDU88_001741 [Pleurodeles waltl]
MAAATSRTNSDPVTRSAGVGASAAGPGSLRLTSGTIGLRQSPSWAEEEPVSGGGGRPGGAATSPPGREPRSGPAP